MAAWNPGGEKRERARRCIYPVFFFFFFRVTHDGLKAKKGLLVVYSGNKKRKQILALGLCELLSLKIRSQRVSSIKHKSGQTKLWSGVQ